MYFFRFLTRPTKKNDEYGKVAGAYANCWVNVDDLHKAEQRVRRYLHKWCWTIEGTDEVLLTRLEDNLESDRDLRYYREAEEKGISVILHKWPLTRMKRPRTRKTNAD